MIVTKKWITCKTLKCYIYLSLGLDGADDPFLQELLTHLLPIPQQHQLLWSKHLQLANVYLLTSDLWPSFIAVLILVSLYRVGWSRRLCFTGTTRPRSTCPPIAPALLTPTSTTCPWHTCWPPSATSSSRSYSCSTSKSNQLPLTSLWCSSNIFLWMSACSLNVIFLKVMSMTNKWINDLALSYQKA